MHKLLECGDVTSRKIVGCNIWCYEIRKIRGWKGTYTYILTRKVAKFVLDQIRKEGKKERRKERRKEKRKKEKIDSREKKVDV